MRTVLHHLLLTSEAATDRLAQDLAVILKPGDVLALVGDLGAGKSTFARALLRARAANRELEVPSPTFTLVQPYEFGRLMLHHFDLYRLGAPQDVLELGFQEAITHGAALVEWPQRAVDYMPERTLILRLIAGDDPDTRRAELIGEADLWTARLERTFTIRAMLAKIDPEAWRTPMAGDAAVNRFERVATAQGSLIVMDWPQRHRGSRLADGLTAAEARAIQLDPHAVVAMHGYLAQNGFTAPKVLAQDLALGLILMTDLGAGAIVGRISAYQDVVDVLAELSTFPPPHSIRYGGLRPHTLPVFDRRAYHIELNLFLDWGYAHLSGNAPSEAYRATFLTTWDQLIDRLLAAPHVLCLHDVIAPNIIYRADEPTSRARVGLIDTQDAFIGPLGYDLASLVTDVRVDVPQDWYAGLIERFQQRNPALDPEMVTIIAAQRLTKIIGGFAMLAKRDGRPAHLAYLPQALTYLRAALDDPALSAVASFYAGLI